MLTNIDIKDAYPLSPMQQGILFHCMVDNRPTVYLEQFDFPIRRELDKCLVEESFNQLIEKYDIFRSIFVFEKVKKPSQVVLKKRKIKLFFQDISHLDTPDRITFMENFRNEDRKKGFNLGKDIPMRVSLIKLDRDSYRLVWSFHHIIMDGWCLGIILKELLMVYQTLEQGKTVNLVEEFPYSNYIQWLAGQDQAEGLTFWRNYLEGYKKQASLPRSGKYSPGYKLAEHCFFIDETTSTALKKIAKSNQATMSTLFQTIWGILLQKYNNTNDVVFGAVVSGRPPVIEGIEKMVGLFINTIPVRIKTEEPATQRFSQLLQKRQQEMIMAKPLEYIPLAEIQSQSLLKGDLIHNNVIFENYPIQQQIIDTITGGGFNFQGDDISIFEQTNYDYNLIFAPGTKFLVRQNYNARVYEPAFVKRIGTQFLEIVKQIIKNCHIILQDIEISNRLLAANSDQFDQYQKDFGF